jgi:protein tyrosine/serine phosphatase
MFKVRRPAGLKVLIVAGLLAIASVGSYGGIMLATGNVHTITDGVLYRSAQLTKDQYEAVIRKYGIKSILNLRGGHLSDGWYADEIEVSNALGVTHFDYPISARRRVSGEQIAEILSILRAAPKPLLIHCRSGADRSGLVAALFRLEVEHAEPSEADRQLSLAFGHFPYLFSKTVAMDESFWGFAGQPADPPAAVR